MTMIHTTCPIRVRYAETDAMGMAHHATFPVWFEAARVSMMDDLDLPYREIEAAGFFMPVLEVQVRFLAPVRFDDRISVHVRIEEPPRARMTVRYEVYREDELVATGWSRHAFINPDGEAVKPPQAFVNVMNPHFEAKSSDA